ncbi:MAG: hypothetical protein KGR26_02955 [Cyanobacteria bacterium REEB65]|nr:hypothetical protein [Cyanobacteria bacterium REEB65]
MQLPGRRASVLNAFTHEVDAQDGKHVNHSAATMLTANVEYAQTLLQ